MAADHESVNVDLHFRFFNVTPIPVSSIRRNEVSSCGFIVTPSMGPTIVDSFQITTANDSAERDPTSWELYGTLDAILSGDNTEGTVESWTPIASGAIAFPDERFALGPLLAFSNSTTYTSYKLLFPTLKDADVPNSMQIAEVQFYGVPEPATICLLGLGALALLRRRRRIARGAPLFFISCRIKPSEHF